MKKTIHIHYDNEGDLFELCVGEPTPGYMRDIGHDIFERVDEKTKKVTGFTILNFKKRTEKFKAVDIQLSDELEVMA